jgi:hypothetical protein
MRSLKALIEKYTKAPYNKTVDEVTRWYASHRSLGAKASSHRKMTNYIQSIKTS